MLGAQSPALADRLYRLSVAQYQMMIESGILTEDDPVELIEGLLVIKMGKNDPHLSVTRRLVHWISKHLPESWFVSKEDPLQLARSEPEPDVAVLRGTRESFDDQKPRASDVALVVEASGASYPFDREKRLFYADAGIPEYWIINLSARRVEVDASPTGGDDAPDYQSRTDYAIHDAVPLVLDGHEFARLLVRDRLPPEKSEGAS